MEQVTQNTNPSTPRDYDKDPIVIEDYNYIFYVLYVIWGGIIIAYMYLINPFGNTNHISKNFWFMHFIVMSALPIITFYFQMKKSKRSIILNENDILFKENETVLERIELKNIESIHRTFNDYYRKNQEVEDWSVILIFAFLPINLTIHLINKFLFHLYKNGLKNYKFFDSIIIFDDKSQFINIMPTTAYEYELIKEYFRKKLNYHIPTAKIFFKINYGNEQGANK